VDRNSGFREIEHTADWELEVWAPDLSGLFEQAALGMYELSGTRIKDKPRLERTQAVHAMDSEGLLVSFLSELLYFGEKDGLGFDRFDLTIDQSALNAKCYGAPIARQNKEIKAVTYHNLAIRQTRQGLAVNIVFDV
jgi:SHS2 domain-containing protein